jgi:transposase-like protein
MSDEIEYNAMSCPDPEQVVQEALIQIAISTKKQLCKTIADAKNYTDTAIETKNQEFLDRIDIDKVLATVEATKELLKSLDINGDGEVLDTLLEIKRTSDEAKSLAQDAYDKAVLAEVTAREAKEVSDKAQKDVLETREKLVDHQLDTANKLAKLEEKIDNKEVTGGGVTETEVNVIVEQSAEKTRELICANNRRLASGLKFALEAVIEIMEGDCPVEASITSQV